MAENYALEWDAAGERQYETGTDRGVVYPLNTTTKEYDSGFAWNGLTGVTKSPDGADATDVWADNMKYLTLRGAENFGGTITAYMCPEEFEILDGTARIAPGLYAGQQKRGVFGFVWRTRVGNDVQLDDFGYKLHLCYGATVSPSSRDYKTVNDNPEAIELSWEFKCTPVNVSGYRAAATLTLDTTKLTAEEKTRLATLEQILYGTPAGDGVEAVAPRLPLPDEVAAIMNGTNNGGQG